MTSYSYNTFELDSEYICCHILNIRKTESQSALVERFRILFIEGVNYPEVQVLNALNRIVMSKWACSELPHLLNRCCYSLINYWWSQPGLDQTQTVYELVDLFKSEPSSPTRSETTQRLQKLVRDFTQTQQYKELQRKAWVSGSPPQTQNKLGTPVGEDLESQSIPDVIHRYPLLYPYYLARENTDNSGNLQANKCLQKKKQQQFDQDLFNYVTHMHSSTVVGKNPTLLSTDKLRTAITKFAGPVEGDLTYRDAAQQHLETLAQVKSYQNMKIQVYEYLSSSIVYSAHPSYGEHRFNDWLYEKLKNFLPERDTWKPIPNLLMRTCRHLISTLLAKPDEGDCKSIENHVMFTDINGNLKPTFTVGLLLKIVLLCADTSNNLNRIKSHIASHFADMCRHYESNVKADWLIECLDNLMIAFTVNFGRHRFSDWTNLLA